MQQIITFCRRGAPPTNLQVTQSSYYRAKYYDPSAGRFLNEDPLGLNAGPNLYRYVGNNASTYFDPFGLFQLTTTVNKRQRRMHV
jgi:RHS repeat-associated protein